MTEEKNGGKAAALRMLPTFREVAAKLDADPTTISYLEEGHYAAMEMPLEVNARSGWYAVGGDSESTAERMLDVAAAEYAIVFAWGGPAVRAYKAAGGDWQLQGQDWGTEYERVCIENADDLKAFDCVCDYILEASSN